MKKNNRVLTSLLAAAMLSAANTALAAEKITVGGNDTKNITNETFNNLQVDGNGGAVENNGTLNVNNSDFNSNKAMTTASEYSQDTNGTGGGIYSSKTGKINTVNSAHFDGNNATDGGAIYIEDTTSADNTEPVVNSITNSTFSNNTASGRIHSEYLTDYEYDEEKDEDVKIVTGSVSNVLASGGAISGGLINEINNTVFTNNGVNPAYTMDGVGEEGKIYSIQASGGAISGRVANITGSTFTNNYVASNGFSSGGAISLLSNEFGVWNDETFETTTFIKLPAYNITNSTFEGNSVHGFWSGGGAIASAADIIVNDSKFISNSAENLGGAITNQGVVQIVFETGGENGDLEITHLTYGTAQINNSTFENNTVTNNKPSDYYKESGIEGYEDYSTTPMGGAIANGSAGEVTVNNSTFKGNSALNEDEASNIEGKGGAIYNSPNFNSSGYSKDTILNVANSTFENNTSGDGGAIYNEGIIKEFKGNTFKGNKALSKIVTVSDNTYDENGTTVTYHVVDSENLGDGGAVYSNSGDLTIEDSTFEENAAGGEGGAVFNSVDAGALTVKNSKFINNTSFMESSETGTLTVGDETYTWENKPTFFGNSNGGAIAAHSKNTLIEDSEFTGNSVGYAGGAVYALDSLTVKNSTFKKNSAKADYAITRYNYYSDEGVVKTETEYHDGEGGAIYNDTGDLTVENSTFEENTAGGDGGGAIRTVGVLDGSGGGIINANISESSFTKNTTSENGGAIKGTNVYLTVTDSDFTDNSATNGGAIYNSGKIKEVKNSTFKGNSAISEYQQVNDNTYDDNGTTVTTSSVYTSHTGSGGAIYNDDGEINISDSTFENNKSAYGGAIYNNNDTSGLTIKNSKFINNTSYNENSDTGTLTVGDKTYSWDNEHYGLGSGGAVVSYSDTTIEDSEFDGNTTGGDGGAMYVNADLTVKNSIFKNNVAKADNSGKNYSYNDNGTVEESSYDDHDGYGGAISQGNGDLKIENSSFENNISGGEGGGAIFASGNSDIAGSSFTKNSTAGNGGAISASGDLDITDSSFSENSATGNGGALDTSRVNITDTDFTNNTAAKGGAIYTSSANILAKNNDVTFSGNAAAKGGDIYIDNGIVNLNASEGRKISFAGGISGANATINVNDPSVYENLTSTGTVIVDNFVAPDENSTMAVNVNAGSLKLTRDNYLNGVDLSLADCSTLDMMNGEVGTLELNSLTSNNGNIILDVDALNENQNFDFVTAKTASGTLNIAGINMVSDMPENVNSISADLSAIGIPDTLKIKTQDGGISSLTSDYVYTTVANGKNISVNRLTDDDGNALVVDTFTLSVNQQSTVNGNPVNLSNTRTYTANKDITITGKNIDEGWTGDLGGENLTVNGNGYTLNGNNKAGINITDGKTLSFVDTNIAGFKTSGDRKGAININDGGVVNITASQKDITLGGTTADKEENANIVYLDGTTAKAYFTTENNKSITVNDPMRSSNSSNEVYLKGNGKITFNKLVDPVTIYNDNEDTVHNNYIDGVVYNLNSGKLSFTKDEYLNGQGNPNTLNFNGGTLDIANNSTGTVSLNELNLNANSNIMVDVDLANKQMDRLTAKTYNLNNNYLNVSKMNMLSDSDSLITKLLFADDKLKNNVTTSVSSVAYSPIYKYGVEYDKTTGQFVFTRGGGSNSGGGSTGYDAYNPAVLASPVAAQMGGYMGMLDTYANSFTHMDMNMLKPLNIRMAELNANKYAIADTSNGNNTAYLSNEMNSGGIWFKPYMSYDSVRLKNGPKVNSTSYGSFIGGDSGVKTLGGGFYGVLSPYIAYNGSHQSYSGNSIYQNGGTLGLTGTLYKGNFFTGLTVGTGASGAESSTMYGHDDFGMFMAGVASKTGYNFEFKDGRYIIQPSVQLSYTMVDTFNYTNGAGVSIHSDPLHALQISPNLKFVMNTKNGWQPYLTAGMNWNLIDETKVSANMTSLPDMSVKPYVQYGVGVQKTMKDRLTGFLQVLIRNGGRNGIAANGGFRYMLGKETKNKTEKM